MNSLLRIAPYFLKSAVWIFHVVAFMSDGFASALLLAYLMEHRTHAANSRKRCDLRAHCPNIISFTENRLKIWISENISIFAWNILKIYFRNNLVLGIYFWDTSCWKIIFRTSILTFIWLEDISRNSFVLSFFHRIFSHLSALKTYFCPHLFSLQDATVVSVKDSNKVITNVLIVRRFVPFVLRSDTRGIYRS